MGVNRRQIFSCYFVIRQFFGILIMCWLPFGYSSANPKIADTLVLSEARESHTATPYLAYLEDKSRSLTFEKIRQQDLLKKFTRVGNSTPSFGVTASVYWFHIRVANEHNQTKKWWMEIKDPLLDRIDIYYQFTDGSISHELLGDHHPFGERKIKTRNPTSVLELGAKEQANIFIRIQTYGLLSAPIFFWQPEAYPSSVLNLQMEYGIYYGIIAALFLYNLMVFFSIKDVSYLYYCLFVGSYALWQFSYNGLGYEYLWPNNGQINLIVALLANTFYGFFMLLFTRSFLNISTLFPRLNKFVLVLACMIIIPLTIFFFIDKSIGVKTNVFFIFSAILTVFALGIYTFFRGVTEARYFLLAWLTLIIGILAFNFVFLGWIPPSFLAIHGQQIGSAVEAILLSFALAHRVRLLKEENDRMQAEANQCLEHRVEERTQALDATLKQLEQANELLKNLSLHDPLTGLSNRLSLKEKYQNEWSKSRRKGVDLAVLMIDIDHFKSVNDLHGHLCGDQALCLVAKIVKQVINRQNDIVARYGGEEFIAVLPNTGNEGAYHIAERLRKKMEDTNFVFGGHCIKLTISIGYAILAHSDCEKEPDNLVDEADRALYSAKNNGRNQVMPAVA